MQQKLRAEDRTQIIKINRRKSEENNWIFLKSLVVLRVSVLDCEVLKN
jgi:hypothetical protein